MEVFVMATRFTPAASRQAHAAAGDAPTVTKHAVERREIIVVPATPGAPMRVGSGENVSAPPNVNSHMLEQTNREGASVISCHGEQPASKW